MENFAIEDVDGVLYLCDGKLRIAADFSEIADKGRLRASSISRDPLVKAVRIRGKALADTRVVDATAGLGEDSLILAAAGCTVRAAEKVEILARLLQEAKQKALSSEDARMSEICRRIEFVHADSKTYMRELSATGEFAPDVIYLDPMFPEVRSKSLPKKKMQLIAALAGSCDDEGELLESALALATTKVVVKRPVKGRYLADRTPSFSHSYKTVRFDVYVVAEKRERATL